MRTLVTAFTVLAAVGLAPAEARAGGPFGLFRGSRSYAVAAEPAGYAAPGAYAGTVVGPPVITPEWPYAPLAQIPASDVILHRNGPKPYVSFGPSSDDFVYHGRSLLHPYDPWTWQALSLNRPGLYYYPPLGLP